MTGVTGGKGEYFDIVISTNLIPIKVLLLPKQSRILETDPQCKSKQNTGLSVTEI